MTYLEWLDSEGRLRACPHCGQKDALRHILTADEGNHHAKVVCDNLECGGERFVMWGPKPEHLKARRSNAHRALLRKAKSAGRDACEMCTRHEKDLPASQQLEAHHVTEHKNDGAPTLENVWVLCTPCHRLVHWTRTYFGHYHPDDISHTENEVML